jgi:hypothetical protein
MIAAFVAFGVPASSAAIAVLAYRAISFWLPTLPGIAGYLALRATVCDWRAADAKTSAHGCGELGHKTPCDEYEELVIGVGARLRVPDRNASVC